jgi:hypothetical protein
MKGKQRDGCLQLYSLGRAWHGQARLGKAKQGVWQNYKLPLKSKQM